MASDWSSPSDGLKHKSGQCVYFSGDFTVGNYQKSLLFRQKYPDEGHFSTGNKLTMINSLEW